MLSSVPMQVARRAASRTMSPGSMRGDWRRRYSLIQCPFLCVSHHCVCALLAGSRDWPRRLELRAATEASTMSPNPHRRALLSEGRHSEVVLLPWRRAYTLQYSICVCQESIQLLYVASGTRRRGNDWESGNCPGPCCRGNVWHQQMITNARRVE